MTSYDGIVLAPGSPGNIIFNWPNGAGGNANLTGFTANCLVVGAAAQGTLAAFAAACSFEILNPATGQVKLRIGWVEGWIEGELGRVVGRVIPPVGDSQSTNAISVRVGLPK